MSSKSSRSTQNPQDFHSKKVPNNSSPEIRQLENLLEYSNILRVSNVTQLEYRNDLLNVHAITMGSERDDAPVVVFLGGVHGVERIGTQVVLAFLESLIQRMHWDQSLIDHLQNVKLVFVPIVNPTGLLEQSRCNHQGIDLMRNAPIDAQDKASFLLGGQRISKWLPWYRGKKGSPMAPEAQGVCDLVQHHYQKAPITIVLDVHSGFGFDDRLWIPFAGSKEPIPNLAEYYALHKLLNRTYPHLNYIVEPQCLQYITHGDLWDYMYMDALEKQRMLLPITLEMGSWRWVRKNPLQMLSSLGFYNPLKPHRLQRVLRGHNTLMEFLIRATSAHVNWMPNAKERVFNRRAALRQWFEKSYG